MLAERIAALLGDPARLAADVGRGARARPAGRRAGSIVDKAFELARTTQRRRDSRCSAARGRIHFVGIGGIGMSGIAELLANLGYDVSGSDAKRSDVTDRLEPLGVRVCDRARRRARREPRTSW